MFFTADVAPHPSSFRLVTPTNCRRAPSIFTASKVLISVGILYEMSLAPLDGVSPSESGGTDGSDPCSGFFDDLPCEVLDNILRYSNDMPNAKDWVPQIPLDIIIGFHGVEGELGRFMKNRFNMLCISESYKSADEGDDYKWKNRNGDMLWTDDLELACRFVLAGGRENLHTIIITVCEFYEDGGTGMVHDFYNICPNVTSLSIYKMKEDGYRNLVVD